MLSSLLEIHEVLLVHGELCEEGDNVDCIHVQWWWIYVCWTYAQLL